MRKSRDYAADVAAPSGQRVLGLDEPGMEIGFAGQNVLRKKGIRSRPDAVDGWPVRLSPGHGACGPQVRVVNVGNVTHCAQESAAGTEQPERVGGGRGRPWRAKDAVAAGPADKGFHPARKRQVAQEAVGGPENLRDTGPGRPVRNRPGQVDVGLDIAFGQHEPCGLRCCPGIVPLIAFGARRNEIERAGWRLAGRERRRKNGGIQPARQFQQDGAIGLH